MPRHLHLDFETFSKAPLTGKDGVGAFRYAFDPSTEILIAAVALDDEEPIAWIPGVHSIQRVSANGRRRDVLAECFAALKDPDVEIWCHNAQFEMAICLALFSKTFGFPCPDLSRFRCTKNLARRACIPNSLESCAEFLKLGQQKDKRGAKLIKLFSVMQPPRRKSKLNPNGLPPVRIYPKDRPREFAEFREYCIQDVRTEQAIYKKLRYFADPINDASYSLDAKINARGVTLNVDALHNAQKIIREEEIRVGEEFRQLTGYNPTQRDMVLQWFHTHGAPLPDLTAETIEEALEAPFTPTVRRALRLKRDSSYAAVKKVNTMLACVGPHDNRVRGMLVHHGANTGRWTSEKVQLQNAKRPTKGMDTEEAYREICEGIDREMLDIVYGPPLEVISSCIRHFVQDGERGWFNADYAAIEARLINWLAGQEDALEEYRKQVDRYKIMASLIYGIPVSEVNDFPQRFIGKQATLGCGYGMGGPKFRQTCEKFGYYDLPAGLEFKAVEAFRAKHRKVCGYWSAVEKAAKQAIMDKGTVYPVRNVSFLHGEIEGLPWLLCKLPSGRKLAYPRPEVKDGSIRFYGNIKGTTWGPIVTWGGTLAENITQAVAADIMANGALIAESAGYEIATMIHDEALAYRRKPGQSIEEFIKCLTTLPSWADGLPIAAEGKVVPFYKKG